MPCGDFARTRCINIVQRSMNAAALARCCAERWALLLLVCIFVALQRLCFAPALPVLLLISQLSTAGAHFAATCAVHVVLGHESELGVCGRGHSCRTTCTWRGVLQVRFSW
jgi:hypothetical protein